MLIPPSHIVEVNFFFPGAFYHPDFPRDHDEAGGTAA
jgi:hypothetical protein